MRRHTKYQLDLLLQRAAQLTFLLKLVFKKLHLIIEFPGLMGFGCFQLRKKSQQGARAVSMYDYVTMTSQRHWFQTGDCSPSPLGRGGGL